jgi:hypothetical protein
VAEDVTAAMTSGLEVTSAESVAAPMVHCFAFISIETIIKVSVIIIKFTHMFFS